MRIRSFIIAYALVLAILLFADRRPGSTQQDRYSHVVDLTDAQNATAPHASISESRTRIIAPGALIPGTWAAAQIPPERLIAPLVVLDVDGDGPSITKQISLDDIAAWESHHGMIPQGSVVAIRRVGLLATKEPSATSFPIARDAAEFLIDARSTIGFALETPVDLTSDRTLARQIALHGNYVVQGASRFTALPATGSLIIVAPAVAPTRNKTAADTSVRVLAMVR
jgi:kynurenine formamidase